MQTLVERAVCGLKLKEAAMRSTEREQVLDNGENDGFEVFGRQRRDGRRGKVQAIDGERLVKVVFGSLESSAHFGNETQVMIHESEIDRCFEL